MENQETVSSKDGAPCESTPFFEHEREKLPVTSDPKDRAFAVVYLLLAYLLVSIFTTKAGVEALERNLGIFIILYAGTVLAYLFIKGKRPAKESYFWLAILLGVAVPYGFWSMMTLLQFLGMVFLAAYWTHCAAGGLMENQKTSKWMLFDSWNAVWILPIYNFTCQFRVFARKKAVEERRSFGRVFGRQCLMVLFGFAVILPVLVVVLRLLSSADAEFGRMVLSGKGFLSFLTGNFWGTVFRAVAAIPISACLFGLIYGGITKRNTNHIDRDDMSDLALEMRIAPSTLIVTALSIIILTYGLFIGLQGTYLFSAFRGIRPEAYTYAEYARQGFFELCMVAVINLGLLFCANFFCRKARRENLLLRWINVIISVETLLLVATAMSKMLLYIQAYGLTEKRVGTMAFMIWLALVFLMIIIWQWREIPLVRIAAMGGAVIFCVLCLLPVSQLIIRYNLAFGFHS